MKHKLIAATLSAAALCPLSAWADEPMEIQVVTPTRTEQASSETIADTTVITAADIRKAHAPDVPTLLRDVAGVEISQPGGIGKPASVYMRGTNDNQVLVLVDGVRMNSATTGATAIDQLMADQIDHIEIVRGNVSSLYGSEAIGGVIQIFTKQGHGAPAVNASAGVGSLGTREASAGIGGSENGTNFALQASTFRTDGVSALNPALVPTANPDRDGYRNNSVSMNLGHAFNADHRISASLFGSNGNNQYDNAFGVPTDVNASKQQLWKLSLASDDQITDTWHSRLQVANGVDQYRDYLNGQPTVLFGQPSSLFQTTSNQLGWQNTLRVRDKDQMIVGTESLRQHVSTDITPGYAVDSRTINSFYAGYTGHYEAHELQLNGRQDQNSQYGNANTGLVGYGYAINDAWRLTTSYSTAFKAPTFNELYYPNYGNPALRPEYSHNIEGGVHYGQGGQHVDLVVFRNKIDNLIVPNAAYTSAINLNEARIRGTELMYDGKFGDTGIRGALTSQSARDALTNQPLVRRAHLYGNLGVTQQAEDWQFGGEWQYSASRYDSYTDPVTFVSSPEVLPSYNVFNLTAEYALTKQTRLALRADNLTNQNDSSAYGYNPLGRRFFVSVNYRE